MAELTSLNSNPAITDRSRKQTGCKLLSLPSELQTAIWELVLFANGTVVDIRKTYQAPQLLHTCQQVSDEAGSLYYGTATFSVKAERGSDTNFEHRSPSGLCILWLTTRAFGASKHVRRVRLDLYNSAGTSSGWMDVWKPIALQMLRDKIISEKLGDKIEVDATAGEPGRVYKYW